MSKATLRSPARRLLGGAPVEGGGTDAPGPGAWERELPSRPARRLLGGAPVEGGGSVIGLRELARRLLGGAPVEGGGIDSAVVPGA